MFHLLHNFRLTINSHFQFCDAKKGGAIIPNHSVLRPPQEQPVVSMEHNAAYTYAIVASLSVAAAASGYLFLSSRASGAAKAKAATKGKRSDSLTNYPAGDLRYDDCSAYFRILTFFT